MLTVMRFCGHSVVSNWLNEKSIVIDLGLNKGEFASQMIQYFGSKIYGVEPCPELFSHLPELPGLISQEIAIFDTNGEIMIHLNPSKCASVINSLKEEGSVVTTVKSVTFEQFISQHNLDFIDLVKMDIEGAEIGVLSSTKEETLRKIGQITVEFHDFLDPKMKERVIQIHQRLERIGFFRINFSVDNTDVLYINRSIHQITPFCLFTIVIRYKYIRGFKRRIKRLFS